MTGVSSRDTGALGGGMTQEKVFIRSKTAVQMSTSGRQLMTRSDSVRKRS